uniref:Uncharacterized protein n=1 Tax=Avena sativa TaxID=4498 RepID=A0ACD5TUZ2_AVESA
MATARTDSAAAAARRFAVACGVLSQYVKSAGPGPAPVLMPMPMSLSMSASGVAARAGAVQEPDGPPANGAQQLTIFYRGRVVVLDGCTPARASELILYATAGAAPTPVDIPIARKVSLKRFLSKRKDRPVPGGVVGRWEEETAAPPPAKKGKTEASSWLALGSLGDMHAQ